MDQKGLKKEYISKSAAATKRFAQMFAKELRNGDILAIYGPLGAGKTTFIQGLAAGLGYRGRVTSPTFIFVRPYKLESRKLPPARLRPSETQSLRAGQAKRAERITNRQGRVKTLYHVDLYRIESPLDLETIGIEEFLADEEAISAIEWPEKIRKFPAGTRKIKIETIGENERKITLTE